MDKEHYRLLKIDFYDRKGALLRRLAYHGYQQYLDRYWRADEMHLLNHQTGKSTILKWHKYEFATGLADKHFNKRGLKRAR